jgi:cytochrome c biogenesis factor
MLWRQNFFSKIVCFLFDSEKKHFLMNSEIFAYISVIRIVVAGAKLSPLGFINIFSLQVIFLHSNNKLVWVILKQKYGTTVGF